MNKRLIAIGCTVTVFTLAILAYGWDRAWTAAQHTYFQLWQNPNLTYTSVIETVNFTSQALNGQQRELKIYLPSAYNPKGHYRYPVLYLLHGYPGADTDWLINANLQPVLDRMIANRCQGWASSGNTVQLKIARSLIKSAKAGDGARPAAAKPG